MTLAVQPQSDGVVTPHPALAILDESGLLDAIESQYAEVQDLSRAHPVWRVSLPNGRRMVVKAGRHSGGPDLAVECLVYRMAVWCEPVAAALPEAVVIDEDHQVLVLADVGDPAGSGSLAQQMGFPSLLSGTSYPPPDPVSPAALAALSRTIGSILGRLHRATAGFPLPPAPRPLVLAAFGGLFRSQPAEPVAAAVQALTTHPQLVRAAEEMARPVSGCLVNHDMKWDNVVVQRAADVTRPVLLDWELAGLGDPAWDLGCLLAEHLVRAVEPALIDQPAAALLAGYASGAWLRPGVRDTVARRVVLAAGLRIAQLALEVAHTQASGGPDAVERLSNRAASHLDHLTDLTVGVAACLC